MRSAGAERLREGIEGYLRDCYARGSPPRVDELARILGLHPVVLRRRTQRLLNMPVSRLVKHAQLRFACELLDTSALSITDVARRSAFGSVRSFLRAFRREHGQTPSDYRCGPKVSLDTTADRADVGGSPSSRPSNQ